MVERETRKMNFSASHSSGRALWPRWMPIQPGVRRVSLWLRCIRRRKSYAGGAGISTENRRRPRGMIVGRNRRSNQSIAAKVFRQRIIADFLDVFLAVVAANPVEIGGGFALVRARIHIDREVAPDGIRSGFNIVLGRFNRG